MRYNLHLVSQPDLRLPFADICSGRGLQAPGLSYRFRLAQFAPASRGRGEPAAIGDTCFVLDFHVSAYDYACYEADLWITALTGRLHPPAEDGLQ